MRRTALHDTQIADQQIAEGEKVIMYYGAADRDPTVFDKPDSLDVARSNANKHVAFGYGPHVCSANGWRKSSWKRRIASC